MVSFKGFQRGPLSTVEWTSGGGGPAERFVVLCHGFGAPGTDLVGLGTALESSLPPTRWVFPAALLAPAEMSDWGGRAWWSLRISDILEELASAGDAPEAFEKMSLQVPDGLDEARSALATAVEEARSGYEDLPFVLGGFSQGAMLASDVSIHKIIEPDRLILFSGAPIASGDWGELAPIGLPAVVSHGRFDEVLPFPCGELLKTKLEALHHCDVEFSEFAGGHQIPGPALGAAADMIAR